MLGRQVAVLVITTFFVVVSSILLVACRRSGTFLTEVVAAGATCPAVVFQGAAGGLDTCSAELLSVVGNGNMKLREVQQGNEELRVGGRAVFGECVFGCSESCDQQYTHHRLHCHPLPAPNCPSGPLQTPCYRRRPAQATQCCRHQVLRKLPKPPLLDVRHPLRPPQSNVPLLQQDTRSMLRATTKMWYKK